MTKKVARWNAPFGYNRAVTIVVGRWSTTSVKIAEILWSVNGGGLSYPLWFIFVTQCSLLSFRACKIYPKALAINYGSRTVEKFISHFTLPPTFGPWGWYNCVKLHIKLKFGNSSRTDKNRQTYRAYGNKVVRDQTYFFSFGSSHSCPSAPIGQFQRLLSSRVFFKMKPL